MACIQHNTSMVDSSWYMLGLTFWQQRIGLVLDQPPATPHRQQLWAMPANNSGWSKHLSTPA
jgi:hypothetical protein